MRTLPAITPPAAPRPAAHTQAAAARVAQPKTPAATNARMPPNAPPVYRPQPPPRVLQAKPARVSQENTNAAPHGTSAARQNVSAAARASALSSRVARESASRPSPPAMKVPPRQVEARSAAAPAAKVATRGAATLQRSAVPRGGVVQRRGAGGAQGTRFYPNLHPGAVERVEPGSLFRLENFADQYRLRKVGAHGAYVPNQQYNFVRTSGGEMLLHNRYRHPSIAEGRQVLYAGEVFFNNGKLEWWSNGSGHYQPDADDARQAALPLDDFYTYQQVIKGEHKRRKG